MQNDEEQLNLLHLDNQLCFAFYAASRALMKHFAQQLAPLGLTFPQYLVLLVLWEKDDQTVGEIGHHLKLESGTLTPLLKRLEAMDVIMRRRNKADERSVRICLQQKGRDLKEPVRAIRERVGCELGMSQDQLLSLRAEVMSVVEKLEAPEGDHKGQLRSAELCDV